MPNGDVVFSSDSVRSRRSRPPLEVDAAERLPPSVRARVDVNGVGRVGRAVDVDGAGRVLHVVVVGAGAEARRGDRALDARGVAGKTRLTLRVERVRAPIRA